MKPMGPSASERAGTVPFPIRLLWGTTPQQREKAMAIGANWVVVQSFGHRRNDFPFFFAPNCRIAALRRRESVAEVRLERALLQEGIAHAHRLGLKAMVHNYEVSLPDEFRRLYPELYQPAVREYRNCCREVREHRSPCLSDPRVREILSQKIAETLRAAGEDCPDTYAFTFNEGLSGTRVSHRCERCREIPFPQMIKWLADAVRDGIRSVSPRILFFHRTWGLNENDDAGWKNIVRRLEFSEGRGEPWLAAHARIFAPPTMHYVASRELPAYVRMQEGEAMGFITKGTWGDISIDHPLNPYIPLLAAAYPTLVELSWENTVSYPRAFHVLALQFQRMAWAARDAGAAGLAGVPCAWGYKSHHQGHGAHEGAGREWIGRLDESQWRLALINFDCFQALCENPDADLRSVITRAIHRRFRRPLPPALTDFVIESQALRARAINVRGIQCTGETLERMVYQILRYGPTVPGWERRLSRDPANLRRIIREKEANMRRAAEIVEAIRGLRHRMPQRAFDEFLGCFSDLRDETVTIGRRILFHFLLWALKDGTIKPDITTLRRIEQQVSNAPPSLRDG
jgi:hypothetical protein